jgi:MerR family transcriptional regulator, heat shock protein HspR
MTAELGLNLAGVERVLDLETEIQQMNTRIEELERLEEVRRSFRAELMIPYRGSTDIVRAADARPLHARTPRRTL